MSSQLNNVLSAARRSDDNVDIAHSKGIPKQTASRRSASRDRARGQTNDRMKIDARLFYQKSTTVLRHRAGAEDHDRLLRTDRSRANLSSGVFQATKDRRAPGFGAASVSIKSTL